jgi:hypothetical protein
MGSHFRKRFSHGVLCSVETANDWVRPKQAADGTHALNYDGRFQPPSQEAAFFVSIPKESPPRA